MFVYSCVHVGVCVCVCVWGGGGGGGGVWGTLCDVMVSAPCVCSRLGNTIFGDMIVRIVSGNVSFSKGFQKKTVKM